MDEKQLLKLISPFIGGQDNVSRIEYHTDKFYVTVKDAGVVNLEALHTLEGIASAELNRSRIVLHLQGSTQKENLNMAKKRLNYNEVAKNIIANIGGKDNINGVRHCITRVRFKLKDESKANDEIVKNLEGVVSVVHGGGEYMVVIGDAVVDVYNAVCEQLGTALSSSASSSGTEKKGNPAMRVLNTVVSAVGPCLNLLCAGGILKGLLTILQMTGLILPGSGMDLLINASGDAIFYFLPVFLGMNLAKHLKGDPYLGAIIGAILCYPSINGVDLAILGHTFNATYTSSFLPVIAVTAAAVPLASWLKRIIPRSVSNFLAPVITLLIVIPFGFTIIGPIVSGVGNMVNTGITFLLNTVPLIAGIVFSATYQIMILFGIHSALTSFSFISLLEGNPDSVMAMGCLVCFAQIGVVLGMYFKTRDKNLKSVALPAFISGIFGITEPAIYGVTLPRIKMFVLSCIGAAVTGAIVMLTGVKMYTFTGLGVFSLLGMIDAEHTNILFPILAAVVPFVISFIIAFVLYKDDKDATAEVDGMVPETKETTTKPMGRFEIKAPLSGKIVPLTEVPDPTFSSGMLGSGFAVEPSEGKVYAPFDGVCTTIFETLHAMGLQSEAGIELLIHVGLETVSLNGKPFQAHIKSGEPIKKGQLLLEFDIDAIKAAGYTAITPVVVVNQDGSKEITVENDKIIVVV
jgi:PTS system beta-glucosides-specific IIC component